MGLILLGAVVVGGGTVGTVTIYVVYVSKYRKALRAIGAAREAAEEALRSIEDSVGGLRAELDGMREPEASSEPPRPIEGEVGEQFRRYIEEE